MNDFLELASTIIATRDRNAVSKAVSEATTAVTKLSQAYCELVAVKHAQCQRVKSKYGNAAPARTPNRAAGVLPMEGTETTKRQKMTESEKCQKFQSRAEQRIDKILHTFNLLSKMTDSSRYHYDQADLDKINGAVTKGLRDTLAVLGRKTNGSDKHFRF